MRIINLFLTSICLIAFSCSRQKEVLEDDKKANVIPNPPKPKWLESGKVTIAIDSNLSHRKNTFSCDSMIIINYNGAFGEDTYMPINDKGQWISTVKKTKRLSAEEIIFIQKIFGSKSSFTNPKMVFCFEPRIGIVYYKNNIVIAQSAICLGCCRMISTAKLGNGENYASYNELTSKKLISFYDKLDLE